MKTYAPEHESILKEAERTTHGDRQQDYGHPFDNHDRIAKLANILLGRGLTASDIALIMICVKLSREVCNPKRDNRVDLAGFAWVLDRCREQEEHDYAQEMKEMGRRVNVPAGTIDEKELLDIPHFLRQDPQLIRIATHAMKTMADRIAETEAKAAEDESSPYPLPYPHQG